MTNDNDNAGGWMVDKRETENLECYRIGAGHYKPPNEPHHHFLLVNCLPAVNHDNDDDDNAGGR